MLMSAFCSPAAAMTLEQANCLTMLPFSFQSPHFPFVEILLFQINCLFLSVLFFYSGLLWFASNVLNNCFHVGLVWGLFASN